MANQLSKEARFKYGSNSVGNITSISLSGTGETTDTNNFSTGKIRQALVAGVTVTASVSGQLDQTDTTGQNQLRSDFFDADVIRPTDFSAWTIEPETPAAGDRSITGACVVTGYSEDYSSELDLQTYTVEIQITSLTETETT